MAKLFALAFLAAMAFSAQAKDAVPIASDPALEQRLNKLTENLRCLVCQNQSIADSNAGLAVDLKNQVREMMVQGQSDQQIADFMVQRYGDFVLFRPPVKTSTWLLWFGPLLLLLAGGAGLLRKIVRQRKSASDVQLDDTVHKRVQVLLEAVKKEETV